MIAFKKFGGSLADADLTTNYTSDGRLSGIDATTTGEGDTIIKNAATLATTLAGAFFLVQDNRNRREDPVRHDCRTIAEIASSHDESKTKTVTLTYTVTVNYTGPGGGVLIAPDGELSSAYKPGSTKQIELRSDPASDDAYNQLWLIKRFPMRVQVVRSRLKSTLEPVWAGHTGLNATDQDDKFAALKLNRTAAVSLRVTGPNSSLSGTSTSWGGEVSVPVHSYYAIPVPTGSAFGKEAFSLTLGDDGRITKLRYGTEGVWKVRPSSGTGTQLMKALALSVLRLSADWV